MKPLRVLALTRYGPLGGSSRLRFLQYLPSLAATDIHVQVQALFDDHLLKARYSHGQYALPSVLGAFKKRIQVLLRRRTFDLLWIEKEALPWCPLWLEASLLCGVPYVLDYDDAVFHTYDLHRWGFVRRLLGKRLDGLMAHAALVVCGNGYLAKRAEEAQAPRVEILPTVIDLDRYNVQSMSLSREAVDVPRIVWIGSPSTARYLRLLHESLQRLAQSNSFFLRVIGAKIDLPGVPMECVPWDEDTEVSAIAQCDMGVMPLLDSSWERGKCGYKLVQYMACGLPVVASPVGVNTSIVEEGVNGFLAKNTDEWVEALQRLLSEPLLRSKMGQAGRARVEQQYCLQVTAPKLAGLLQQAARKA